MPRWLLLLALLPYCTGCLYYAYPTVIHTPDLAVENKDGSVHAFRVDIDKTDRKPLAPLTIYTLANLPIDSRGLIPSQLEVAPASGMFNPLGVVEGGQHDRSQFTMLVRVYRPGFRTNEVKAWEKSRPLQWFAAADILSQERAIDDLLAVPMASDQTAKATWWELKDEKSPGFGLQPGAVSVSQRKALEFAAGEYQRLASSGAAMQPGQQTLRERLQQKAIWLQRYAVQPPTN